jgi:hypothetical protein
MGLGALVGPIWAGSIYDVHMTWPFWSGAIACRIALGTSFIYLKSAKPSHEPVVAA